MRILTLLTTGFQMSRKIIIMVLIRIFGIEKIGGLIIGYRESYLIVVSK